MLPEGYPILVEKLAPQESLFRPREDGESVGEGVPLFLLNPDFSIKRSDRFWLSPTPDIPSIGWKARCHRVAGILGFQATLKDFRKWIEDLLLWVRPILFDNYF